jgi:hypothetical protein
MLADIAKLPKSNVYQIDYYLSLNFFFPDRDIDKIYSIRDNSYRHTQKADKRDLRDTSELCLLESLASGHFGLQKSA